MPPPPASTFPPGSPTPAGGPASVLQDDIGYECALPFLDHASAWSDLAASGAAPAGSEDLPR